jgi:hypothetical protein
VSEKQTQKTPVRISDRGCRNLLHVFLHELVRAFLGLLYPLGEFLPELLFLLDRHGERQVRMRTVQDHLEHRNEVAVAQVSLAGFLVNFGHRD